MSGSAPFCGPNTVAAPIGPSSGCSTSVAAMSSTPASSSRAAARRARVVLLTSVPSAATAVGACAAAEPHHDPLRACPHRGGDQLSHSPAVPGQRGLDGRRATQQRQPAGLRAFDVGGPGRGRVEHPLRGHLPGQRAAHAKGAHLTEPPGQHADEAGSAVGLRGQRQLIVGAAPAPAVGDRLRGLDRREAVAVAVRGDQNPHDGRL